MVTITVKLTITCCIARVLKVKYQKKGKLSATVQKLADIVSTDTVMEVFHSRLQKYK